MGTQVIQPIQAYLRHTAEAGHQLRLVGPFTIFLHPTDTSPGASYAIPDREDYPDWAEATERLAHAFRAEERRPSVKFLEEYAPRLVPTLSEAGFAVEWQGEVLACTREQLRPAPAVPGLSIVTLTADSSIEEIMEGLDANELGFDPNAAPASEAAATEFRRTLTDCRAFTARVEGKAAGAAMFNSVREGVTELVGIATMEEFRRRGVAASITAFVAESAFIVGARLVFLTTDNAQAAHVYRRVGFERCGTLSSWTSTSSAS